MPVKTTYETKLRKARINADAESAGLPKPYASYEIESTRRMNRREIQSAIYRGEIDATDSDGVETMRDHQ